MENYSNNFEQILERFSSLRSAGYHKHRLNSLALDTVKDCN